MMQVEIHGRIDAQALIEAGRLLRLKSNVRVLAFVPLWRQSPPPAISKPGCHLFTSTLLHLADTWPLNVLDMRLALNYNS